MIKQLLNKFAGTKWSGSGELWLDPEGNNSDKYDCDLTIDFEAIHYSWVFDNEIKKGSFIFNADGAIWADTWHQPEPVQCFNVAKAWGIFTINYAYEVPNNPKWGWQSKLSERPDGSLVLQMTNITPWGEEGRAVRMVFTREKA